ncbi:copper-binding protein [Methylocystis sp. MJC1]|jgi:Cu(I)/Ag(I) efflux system membrane fusion protein|uniref:copper-binding protein n=1 Tax=Methylocystis sp. MJC1 TaxID=2654282 RepID=UPI0013EB6506|nr:copper-binding protein [Methylocystis sp. MJC1]KAF2991223.1 Cation efflux system protein CusF [Methylocystis sp. MJC1]MBU6526237.1 copper-binding protein [Methylocystis sp. MJC1]UZX12691.1 copper-binding protein [Methylocystis sp. MJC1]
METALGRVLILAAATGLAIAGVGAVAAQSRGGAAIAEAVEKATGKGVVEAVNKEERQLRITHEAIPALKWPGMTMAFKVAPEVSLEGLAPGAQITFTLSKSPHGGYVIDQIQRVQ